jgi:1-acyl-sn-glycerol-3-phosphate acyltransferase
MLEQIKDSLTDSPALTPIERAQIRFVKKTFEPGVLDRGVRWCQREIGSRWIEAGVKNVRRVIGEDRLPDLDPGESFVCVANHRSFFDLYAIAAYLVRRGMPHRLVFPVRSNFFYDQPLGFAVNGLMSFFAMYPPVFRERSKAPLNLASIDETVRLLKRGGAFVGLHPEGKRNLSEDPYELLPAQPGVGRIIHQSRAKVLPVFINGLQNGLVKHLAGNATGNGEKVIVAFGAPVSLDDLYAENPSPRIYKKTSERCLEAVAALGQEERAARLTLRSAP